MSQPQASITLVIGRDIHAKRSFVHLLPKTSMRSILRKGNLILLSVSVSGTHRLFAILHASEENAANTEKLLLGPDSVHIGLDDTVKALLCFNGDSIQSVRFSFTLIEKFAAKFNRIAHRVSAGKAFPELYLCTARSSAQPLIW